MTTGLLAGREEVAKALATLLAAGIPRPWDVDSPETMVGAYTIALRGISREALQAAVEDVLTGPPILSRAGRPTFPSAQELRALARSHEPKPESRSGDPLACPEPGCRCGGYADFVIGIFEKGPQVRAILAHEAERRSARPLAEVRCPHHGCHCAAVEVELPAEFDARALKRGGSPVELGVILPGRIYRLWLWECIASQVPGALRVPSSETSDPQ